MLNEIILSFDYDGSVDCTKASQLTLISSVVMAVRLKWQSLQGSHGGELRHNQSSISQEILFWDR